MDPHILLDYALFQLTPTRTRCDLIIFSGAIKEKLASGLVEPFISHLKFAKDQIPKGGYSITLRPPTATHSPWFTKSTFQRVVRFISTPEIIERFVRIELEISQIECSVQSNESTTGAVEGRLSPADRITKKSPDSSKSKGENGGVKDGTQEENSKIQLQRLLETRKTLLRKEQAMAYARAFVAGFEMDNMNDLILFSDAFGASRLRQACMDFMELCKKKHTDGLWMDELAAMAACSPSDFAYTGASGIMLTPESNATILPNGSLDFSSAMTTGQVNLEGNRAADNDQSSSDQAPSTPAKVAQMPWMNQIPQYMYNFQNPGSNIPQYQGYHFPNMQPIPPYYHGPMHWPQNADESSPQNRKSSSRKKDKHGVRKPQTSEDEEELESSDSEDDSDENEVKSSSIEKSVTKKHRKKSSKTVVIRNINYITSKTRNGETDTDGSSPLDEEFLDEVESLSKNHKPRSHSNKKKGAERVVEDDGSINNEGWDALQNLLMRDERNQERNLYDDENGVSFTKTLGPESEKVKLQRNTPSDSFIVNGRNEGNEVRVNYEDFANSENFRPITKRDSTDADLIMSRGTVQEGQRISSDFVPDTSVIRTSKGEDWFVANHSEEKPSMGKPIFSDDYALEGNQFHHGESGKIAAIDDSFMVQSRESADDQYDSQWKTVISMVEDFSTLSHTENENLREASSQPKVNEPDDPCVVLVRDSVASGGAAWATEMDYGIEIPFTKSDKKSAPLETRDEIEKKIPLPIKSTKNKKSEVKSKDLRGSLSSMSKFEALAKSKKALSKPMVHKSKFEQEEEIRKRMEEVAIERQKRIAERTAASKSKVSVSSNSDAKKLSSPKVGPAKATTGPSVLGPKKQGRI